jgi:hypothetical protein
MASVIKCYHRKPEKKGDVDLLYVVHFVHAVVLATIKSKNAQYLDFIQFLLNSSPTCFGIHSVTFKGGLH